MLKLTGIFQDNMVIRRNKPIQVWGTGTPNTIVTVSLLTATADTMVCTDGSWNPLDKKESGNPISPFF